MVSRGWLCAVSTLVTGGLSAACQGAAPDDVGSVVVGITSDFEPGVDIERLEADISVDGAAQGRKIWSVNGPDRLAFPIELPFDGLPQGTRIDVALSAREASSQGDLPFMSRQVATSIAAGESLLFRARLGWECVPSFQLAGGHLAPACAAPETCIASQCEEPYVPPEALEPYLPTWAVAYADECRPEGAGPPEIFVGQGLEAYSAIEAGDTIEMQLGNQGGYHVWFSARMKNLHRAGCTTQLIAALKSTGEELCDIRVPWDYVPAGDGYCDMIGIRCVVSNSFFAPEILDGEVLQVRAQVIDATGEVGLAEHEITLIAPQN